jgi:hypothetical protein
LEADINIFRINDPLDKRKTKLLWYGPADVFRYDAVGLSKAYMRNA